MKSLLGWVKRRSGILLTYLILLSACLVLFVYKQQSLIPGANVYEREIVSAVDTYEYPWRNPIDGPYKSIVMATKFTGISTLRAARITSAILMVLSILMFYQLLRNWLLSPGKALVGTALFATSSWTLALGRGAHSSVVGIFLLLLVFTLSTRLFFTTRPFLDWLLLIIAVCLSLYTPLSIWLIFLAGVVWMLHIRQRQRTVPLKTWNKIVVASVALVTLAPLVVALINHPTKFLVLLGVDNIVDSIPTLVLNIGSTISSIFFANAVESPIGLGKLPFLDIFSLFMFMLGAYYFERRLSLKRSKILFGGLFIGIIVCSLSDYNSMKVSMLLPLIYIFIAAGLHESISRWLAVFPRNPVARGTGIIILSVAVGFVTFYHLTRSFVARPGNPETRSFYLEK